MPRVTITILAALLAAFPALTGFPATAIADGKADGSKEMESGAPKDGNANDSDRMVVQQPPRRFDTSPMKSGVTVEQQRRDAPPRSPSTLNDTVRVQQGSREREPEEPRRSITVDQPAREEK